MIVGGPAAAGPPSMLPRNAASLRQPVQEAAAAQLLREAVVHDLFGTRRARRRVVLFVEDRLYRRPLGVRVRGPERPVVVDRAAEEILVFHAAVLAEDLDGKLAIGLHPADRLSDRSQVLAAQLWPLGEHLLCRSDRADEE